MKSWIKRKRHIIECELGTTLKRRFFSPAYYTQYIITVPLMQIHASGRLIDIGCGTMPYRELLMSKVKEYHGLDNYPHTPDINYIGDAQNMSFILDKTYDTAICLEVLEHLPEPEKVLQEMFRILRPGGKAIVSVPHLSRLHNEPNDYYRFTKYGLRYLCEKSGFEIYYIVHRGGLCCFLGHQISTIFLCLTWGIPLLQQISWFINSWLITRLSFFVDQVADKGGMWPMGYTIVLVKPGFDA